MKRKTQVENRDPNCGEARQTERTEDSKAPEMKNNMFCDPNCDVARQKERTENSKRPETKHNMFRSFVKATRRVFARNGGKAADGGPLRVRLTERRGSTGSDRPNDILDAVAAKEISDRTTVVPKLDLASALVSSAPCTPRNISGNVRSKEVLVLYGTTTSSPRTVDSDAILLRA